MFMPIANNPLHMSCVQMQDYSINRGQTSSFQSACIQSTAQSLKHSFHCLSLPCSHTGNPHLFKRSILKKNNTPRVTAPKSVTWASPISKSVVLGSPKPEPMLLSSPDPPICCPSSAPQSIGISSPSQAIVLGSPSIMSQYKISQPQSSNPLKEPSEEDSKQITLLEINEEYLQEASKTFGMPEVHPSWEVVTRINLQHLFKKLSSSAAYLPIKHPFPPHPSPTSTTEGNPFKETDIMDRHRDRKRKQKDSLDKTCIKQDEARYSKAARFAMVTLPDHHLPSLSSTSLESSFSSNHATMGFSLETNPPKVLQKNFQRIGADDWNQGQHDDDELQPSGGVGNEVVHASTSSVHCSLPSTGRKPIPPVTQSPSWHLAGIPIQGPLPEPLPHSQVKIAVPAMPTPVDQLQSSKTQPLERTEVISWVNNLSRIIYLQDRGHFGPQDFEKLKMLIQKIKANKAHPYLTAAVLAKTKLAVVLRKFQHKKYGYVLKNDARDINSFWRERLLGK